MKCNHILYLASGSSRRFGANKLLTPVQGKLLYRHGLETLSELVGSRSDCTLTVVSRYEAIREAARTLGHRAVDCPDSEQGISHTIRAGIAALEPVTEEDFLLFVVADQPGLTKKTLERLLALGTSGTETACLSCQGQPGNPTLFSARLIPELLALKGNTGGRAVAKGHRCIFVEADPEELRDIDVQQDV